MFMAGQTEQEWSYPETVYNLCWKHHHGKMGVEQNLLSRQLLERMAEESLMAIGWTMAEIIREKSLDSKGVGQQYINWCKKH